MIGDNAKQRRPEAAGTNRSRRNSPEIMPSDAASFPAHNDDRRHRRGDKPIRRYTRSRTGWRTQQQGKQSAEDRKPITYAPMRSPNRAAEKVPTAVAAKT